MPGLLRIDLWKEPGPFFDLRELLAVIPDDGQRLAWRLFPMEESMWIEGDLSPLGTTSVELGLRVDASESGISLPWSQLMVLAQSLNQTVWGTYIGCKDESTFASLALLYEDDWMYLDRAKPAYYKAVELAFQAVDSSYWLVYAQDDVVLARITAAFKEKVDTLKVW